MKTITDKNAVIVVGQRVHCILYGGKDGTITTIHGEQKPQTCQSFGIGDAGGSADFDIVWDGGTESHKIPEALMRGSVQWRIYEEVYDRQQIIEGQARVVTETANRAAQASIVQKRFDTEVQALRMDPQWKGLEQGDTKNRSAGSFVASNIRKGLKRLHPGIKFSVQSDHNSVRVGWEDGPTAQEVDEFIDKFKDSYFDSSEDLSRSIKTPWNFVFGGCDYVNSSRTSSDQALMGAMDDLFERSHLAGNLKDTQRPSIELIRSHFTDQVPNIDMRISEAVWVIAAAKDNVSGHYVKGGYSRYSWLTDDLETQVNSEQAKSDQSPECERPRG